MTIKEEEKLVEETQPASTLPGYKSKYTGQINEIYNKIANREPFTYNVNDDALYQQMKDQYIRGGQMAMMDTMGQAQAMTGGYGNSYAQSAGQNAYQNYLSGLNEQVPELYQIALNNYLTQGDQMAQQYSMLLDQEATDYNRYQDQMSLVQPQVLAMLENGQMPSDEMLAASGLSPEYIKALYGYIGGGITGGGGDDYTPSPAPAPDDGGEEDFDDVGDKEKQAEKKEAPKANTPTKSHIDYYYAYPEVQGTDDFKKDYNYYAYR